MSFQWLCTRWFLPQICLFVVNISGDAFGIPGHPVRLQCGGTIVKERREELVWRRSRTNPTPLLARGVYVDGNLKNASYFKELAGGRAKLSSDGSLTIHSYEDEDKGWYRCESRYRHVWTELYTFSMYIVLFYIRSMIVDTIKRTQVVIHGWRGRANWRVVSLGY